MIYVVAFDPIKILIGWVFQNDRQNISFVKDEHTYGKKMARNGPKTVIYKGTFVSNQSLLQLLLSQATNKSSICNTKLCKVEAGFLR